MGALLEPEFLFDFLSATFRATALAGSKVISAGGTEAGGAAADRKLTPVRENEDPDRDGYAIEELRGKCPLPKSSPRVRHLKN
jgi:hypothetical protein